MSSTWDLTAPPQTIRDELRAEDSGRYSAVLPDSAASDFEECARCVCCDDESTASTTGLEGWVVLRRRNGTTLALCPTCAGTSHGRRRARSD